MGSGTIRHRPCRVGTKREAPSDTGMQFTKGHQMTELTKDSIEAIKNGAPRRTEGEIVALCDLALEALEMRPHVAQFGEGKLEVILGELECEGNVYIVPAKHQGKVGEITPPELRAARDQWHDGEIVLKFPNQLQALLVAAALTNVKPEDWVFEESQSPLLSLQKVKT